MNICFDAKYILCALFDKEGKKIREFYELVDVIEKKEEDKPNS